jgi:hypothetical protein
MQALASTRSVLSLMIHTFKNHFVLLSRPGGGDGTCKRILADFCEERRKRCGLHDMLA